MTRNRIISAGATAGLAVVLVLVGGVTLGGQSDHPAAPPGDSAVVSRPDPQAIAGLQQQLTRQPRDWVSWAALGTSYVDAARTSLDPSLYPKAEQALRRSLALRTEGNDRALTGLGALAAARHDFAAARTWATRALAVNGHSATAQAVLSDAQTELGDYAAGLAAAQKLDGLEPGVTSFARLSYHAELRGRTGEALRLMGLALPAASAPTDTAFVRFHLGELHRQQGRLAEADAEYAAGLRASPGDAACTAGRARVAVAQQRTDEALRLYRSVVATVPATEYVTELGDVLTALHREPEAAQQYAVVRAQERIARSGGVNVDLELSLFDAEHGAPAAALQAAQAVWQRRRSVHAADALGWALHAAGRDAEALTYANAALRLGTRSAAFHYHRGVILHALGRRVAARSDLAVAMEIDPHFSVLQAPRARSLLAGLS